MMWHKIYCKAYLRPSFCPISEALVPSFVDQLVVPMADGTDSESDDDEIGDEDENVLNSIPQNIDVQKRRREREVTAHLAGGPSNPPTPSGNGHKHRTKIVTRYRYAYLQ